MQIHQRMIPLLISAALAFASAPTFAQQWPPAPITAQESVRPTSALRLSRDEAIQRDAKSYSDLQHIAYSKAILRTRTQDGMGPHIAALRTEFSERAAGLYFEHEPEYKLVVRLVGTAPMPPRKLHIDGVDVPVEFRTGAAARLDDLVHAIGRNLDHLKELLPELQGVGTDEQTGEIVLNILAVGSNREAVAAERNAISRLVGFPVRIDFQDVAERSADIRGGARITSPSSYCTSGFVVKNSSGTNAVSTAAHCEGINTYHNPDGTTHPLNTPYLSSSTRTRT